MQQEVSFEIETSVPEGMRSELLDRFKRYYLMLHPEAFKDIKADRSDGREVLRFVAFARQGKWNIDGEMTIDKTVHVRLLPVEGTPKIAVDDLKSAIISVVKALDEGFRQLVINFVWVKGEKIVPEELPKTFRRVIQRLFSSTLLLLNVLLFAFNIILFILFGFWAVIGILVVQLLFIVFADQVFARMGKWRITKENPQAYILSIQVSQDEFERIGKKKIDLLSLKSEIYKSTFAVGREPSCPAMSDILLKYGLVCSAENISTKVVDVYDIVQRAASKFGAPVPKISISNSFNPNAAASGLSPKRGALLITSGLLMKLNDEEILNVVGHEIGHLEGKDPLFLYAIVSGEFILRLSILFPLFLFNPIIYLIVSTGIIFFIAKFFEARADLFSAMVIGEPKILAESLRKIGFQRLQIEGRSHLRSWLRWDTHPPLYFRIERLERLSTPVKVEHPLIQSAVDVIRGFRAAF